MALSRQEYAAKAAAWDAVDAGLKTFAHMAVAEVFTPLEREVLEYAEAMTSTPTAVTGELPAGSAGAARPGGAGRAHRVHRLAGLAGRVSTAHGNTSQGCSDACEIPLAGRPGKSGAASTA